MDREEFTSTIMDREESTAQWEALSLRDRQKQTENQLLGKTINIVDLFVSVPLLFDIGNQVTNRNVLHEFVSKIWKEC